MQKHHPGTAALVIHGSPGGLFQPDTDSASADTEPGSNTNSGAVIPDPGTDRRHGAHGDADRTVSHRIYSGTCCHLNARTAFDNSRSELIL